MEIKSELAFSNYLFDNLDEASKKSDENHGFLWRLYIEANPQMFYEENHNHLNHLQKLYEKFNSKELINQSIKDYFLSMSSSSDQIGNEESENQVKTFYLNKDGKTTLKPDKNPWEIEEEKNRKEFNAKFPNFELFYKELDITFLFGVIEKCWNKALKCESDEQLQNYKDLVEHKKEVKKMLDELKAISKPDNDEVYFDESSQDEAYEDEPYYLDEIMDSHNHLKDGRNSEEYDLESDEYWNQEGAFEEASDKEDNFY